ncbi:MAG: hypothetical protein KAU62_14850 [Candidatus Heimdallarchaeota archaeon]|nr:hypothetical protein [Candidatus Heimdallarchaeota archaeon]MCK4612431.1 hypothetical protein [Candidatus Heimdallarchaeota archaeon]
MKRRIYTSILFLLLVISIFQTPIIRSTNAATYTSNKISSGGSSYTLYLDLDTTSWHAKILITSMLDSLSTVLVQGYMIFMK